ncbi:MAG: hypothetical protein ACE5KV_03165, partial [Thermoplasmata archaeon]
KRYEEATRSKKPEKRLLWKKRLDKTPREPHPKVRRSIESVTPSPKPSIKDTRPSLRRRAAKESSIKDWKPEHPKPEEKCERCLKSSPSVIRCDFCGRILCNEFLDGCLEKHNCTGSEICVRCGRRIRSELVEISEVCHRFFCSSKCMNECKEEHRYKSQCLRCEPGLPRMNDGQTGTSEAGSDIGQQREDRGRKPDQEEVDESDSDEAEDPDTEDGTSEYDNGEVETEDGDDAEMEDSTDEDYVLMELCNGKPKDEACRDCQEEHCNARYCDGCCIECNFDYCPLRCENDGACKTCERFDDCPIRCMEALEHCDKRHCDGFECRERYVSGMVECDSNCADCKEKGCYYWDHLEDG